MVPKTVLETVRGSMHGAWQNVKGELAARTLALVSSTASSRC